MGRRREGMKVAKGPGIWFLLYGTDPLRDSCKAQSSAPGRTATYLQANETNAIQTGWHCCHTPSFVLGGMKVPQKSAKFFFCFLNDTETSSCIQFKEHEIDFI